MNFDDLLHAPQYSLPQAQKEAVLVPQFNELTRHHRRNCPPYDRLLAAVYPGESDANSLAEIPFLPIALFKTHKLCSVPESEIFKTLTSSGTTGQQVSQIPLDRETAQRQTTALSRIMTHILGPQRLPMILVESASILKDRTRFNARAAGVLGMMNFGRRHFYALDEDMKLDELGEHFGVRLRGKLHTTFGQAFFGFMVALCVVTSRGWIEADESKTDPASLRSWAFTLVGSIYLQIVVGAWFRHFKTTAALWSHIVLAVGVLGLALVTAARVLRNTRTRHTRNTSMVAK